MFFWVFKLYTACRAARVVLEDVDPAFTLGLGKKFLFPGERGVGVDIVGGDVSRAKMVGGGEDISPEERGLAF